MASSASKDHPAFLEAEVNGRTVEVPLAEVCRVGRNKANDLVLDEESVSRNHALVYSSQTGVYCVNDVGSSNGTFVNGARVSSPKRLKDGDTIVFGSCPVKFRHQQQAPPRTAVPIADQTSVVLAQKLITVLVADIRGFTVLAQTLDAATVAKITGTLFREAGQVLRDRGAWGQKYIGDAVMAVWLHTDETTGELANVLAAMASLARIAAGLQVQCGLASPIRIGAGINSGLGTLGNLGTAAVPDHTALGDAVNRAFRLESATKDAGCDVLLGARTYELIAPFPRVRAVLQGRPVLLKGYVDPVIAWGARFEDLLPVLEEGNRKGIG